jgi:signal transduction histidine kinase
MSSREKRSKQSISLFIHSIRFRLVIWFVLILGVVMVVFSAFIFLRQAQEVRSIAVGRLNLTIERTFGQSENEHSNEQTQNVFSVVPGTTPDLNPNFLENSIVALQTTDGMIIQSAGILTPEQIRQLNLPLPGWSGVEQARIPKTTAIQDSRFLFINPAILQNGTVTGYVLVGVPLDANNQLGRLLVTLVIGNLLTLAIALTGGFWLADQALRPVQTITQTARQIGETDLNRRLHLPGRDELTELGNTFDEMLDRLQAAFTRQKQFTADASHELRTPLTIIDLETSRMLSNRRSVDEYERVLRTIQSENKFMIRLVTNLLALARMDAGQMSLKMEPVDLGEVVSEVIERMAPLATTQGVKLIIGELPEITISGDHVTLTQMFTNLVENAIKYSASVTEPQVDVSSGTRNETGNYLAWVRVHDNGVGIAAEHQSKLFDRFYQADTSRTRSTSPEAEANEPESSGTGLGLAIAQWIAHAHHGEIRVESIVGQGSTFEVVLPAYYSSESV